MLQQKGSTTAKTKRVRLDEKNRIRLKPDLSWWEGGKCVFVGDLKYKHLEVRGFKHADVYQMLAYTVSTQLNSGLIIYAAGDVEPASHQVAHLDKRIEVRTLDVSRSASDIQIPQSIPAGCCVYMFYRGMGSGGAVRYREGQCHVP